MQIVTGRQERERYEPHMLRLENHRRFCSFRRRLLQLRKQ
jgi:hypothetical protein